MLLDGVNAEMTERDSTEYDRRTKVLERILFYHKSIDSDRKIALLREVASRIC